MPTRRSVPWWWVLSSLLIGCPSAGTDEDCGAGEVLDASSEAHGCVPTACGTSRWGDIERNSSTVHVAPWGAAGGSGEDEDPLDSIQDALALAVSEDSRRIALAAGTYVENIVVSDEIEGVTLSGRCSALTVLDGSGERESPVVLVDGGEVVLQGVTLTGGQMGAWSSPGGSDLVLRDGVVHNNRVFGLFVSGGSSRLELERVLVRDTLRGTEGAAAGGFGRGIEVEGGANLIARDVEVVRSAEVGVLVAGVGSLGDLDRVRVAGIPVDAQGGSTAGIEVEQRAQLIGRDVTIEGNAHVGLYVLDPGSVAQLTDSTIRDTLPRVDGRWGRGVQVEGGGAFEGTNVVIERNREAGVVVISPGSSAVLRGGGVYDTRPAVIDGVGLVAEWGGFLDVADTEIHGNVGAGIAVAGTGAYAILSDVVVSQTRRSPERNQGMGLLAHTHSVIDARRVTLIDNEGPGAYASEGGQIILRDSVLEGNGFAGAVARKYGVLDVLGGSISGTRFDPVEGGGVGILAVSGAAPTSLEVRGVDLSGLVGPAFYLRGPGRFQIVGSTVSDAGAWPSLPGGVLAVGGVGAWDPSAFAGEGVGLLMQGNAFAGMAADGMMLDRSSATFEPDPSTGAPNSFGVVQGVPLHWQRCDGVPPPEVMDGSGLDADCAAGHRPLGPLLDYEVQLTEVGAIE